MTSYDQLHALAREIDNSIRQADAVSAQTVQERFDQPIPGGLGTVSVSGSGQLLSVAIDPRAVRYANGVSLGRSVVQAIRAAEAKAENTRQQRIVQAEHRLWL